MGFKGIRCPGHQPYPSYPTSIPSLSHLYPTSIPPLSYLYPTSIHFPSSNPIDLPKMPIGVALVGAGLFAKVAYLVGHIYSIYNFLANISSLQSTPPPTSSCAPSTRDP